MSKAPGIVEITISDIERAALELDERFETIKDLYSSINEVKGEKKKQLSQVKPIQQRLKSFKDIKMTTKFEYLHVSSLDREHANADADAVLNINMSGHAIKHIKNVAVKSFSINNSFFNITTYRNKLNFVLTKTLTGGTFESRLFIITLPLGYFENKQLIDNTGGVNGGILNVLLGQEVFKVGTETNQHTITMKYNPDTFKISLTGVAGVGSSFSSIAITPLRTVGEDLWNAFGFTQDQTVPLSDYLADNTITHSATGIYAAQTYQFYASTATAGEKAIPIVEANQSTSMENIQGMYLTSRSLVLGGTYESNFTNGYILAQSTNILEFIQFDQAHYNTISYKPDVLHQHYLNGKDINHIDIGITNTLGQLYKWREIGHFHLVLVFECFIQDEISAQFIKLYNEEGYQKGHTADQIMFGKFR